MDKIQQLDNVVDITTYYHIGDEITAEKLKSLDQLYARIIVVADNESELFGVLEIIRNTLRIQDDANNEMIIWDTYDRIHNEYQNDASK